MPVTDPVADMLTRIRNAIQVRHESVLIPQSRMKVAIAKILKEEGYISDFEVIEDSPQSRIRIFLSYAKDGSPAITKMARVSKPGRRVYRRASEIKPVLSGIGVGIISTSRGMLTFEKARQQGVGGEVICEIW